MAPPSPRRSSRARVPNSQSQHSSSSSGTSNRVERNSRSHNKPSSDKSTPSASLSSEPLDDLEDTLLGRRRKRGQDEEPEKPARNEAIDMVVASDEVQDDEDDEAVRCICGSEDYPGQPPVDGPDADFFAGIEFTEDVTGFFVQCDICKVWQHGACVGIFSAESSPDEYFCEQCRKDLHKVLTASNGQRYSKYVPLHRQSRATSRATSIVKDGARSPKPGSSKNSRPSSASHAANKRRSTMNSRDAAYDDEQLRRAIEASKEASVPSVTEGSIRRSKRARSDSEENLSVIKRQRTNSQSESPPAIEHQEAIDPDDSDDDKSDTKKLKPGRSYRERSEKEDKERQRQEAADKRKDRAERRRADGVTPDEKPADRSNEIHADSDHSEEVPLAVTKIIIKRSEEPPAVVEPPVEPPPVPDTPPASNPTVSSSHKKSSKSHQKKAKGKNQYTKDRETEREDSPARSMSRDIQRSAEEPTPTSHPKTTAAESKSSSKTKQNSAVNKTSMLDMRRRVAAIMDFISRTQVDLAAEGSLGSHSNSTSGEASPAKPSPAHVNGELDKLAGAENHAEHGEDMDVGKTFKELNCIEMMDVLTRDMVKWQNQYS